VATSAAAVPKPRVLLVEDEPLIGLLFDEQLDELGFAVLGPVVDVSAAVDMAGSADFEAAIVDLRLGQANAYPVAETLAARGIPFALTSGLPHSAIEERFAERPYLAKPYAIDDLRALMLGLIG